MSSYSYQVSIFMSHFTHISSCGVGQEDIEGLEKSIQVFANCLPHDKMQVLITPMYAAQAPGANAKVFTPAPLGTRKCILATNIAETSITIPGVKYVIDTGKCKEKRYLAKDTGGGTLLFYKGFPGT
jgi:ATP-dependent RNA helicase DHX33